MIKSLGTLFFLSFATSAASHEFWIEPQDFQVETGANVTADLINGQKFSGIDLAYFSKRVVLFDKILDGTRSPVIARAGDSPAFDKPVAPEGLFTLLYQSTYSTVTYTGWDKFQAFVDHKDFGDIRSLHRNRGLAEDTFKESYARYAKSLVAVGNGAGMDAPRGLEIEIVALKNPYTDDLSDGLPVQVLYKNAPRPNVQVEIFERAAEGQASVSTTRTDANGIALIPVTSGHRYLLDNVVLREPEAAQSAASNAVWETVWASLTFAVP